MSRAAAALVLAAIALIVPAPALTQPAPNPDPLWSEFPLEPAIETVPTPATPTTPTPAPARVEPLTRENPAANDGDEDRTVGLLILLGAVAVAGLVGHRRAGKRRQTAGEVRREPERAGPAPTFERSVPANPARNRAPSVVVASRPRTRPAAALIETLSPQARRVERAEEVESGVKLETHQLCEIACWRGYVKWQFHVESEPPDVAPLVSPYFRAPGKGAPEQTEAARHAHAVLVEALAEAGWEPEGYGEEWFSERFQRPSV